MPSTHRARPPATPTPPANVTQLPVPPVPTDRDTSWLQFNERVLTLADDPQVPLLEKLRYLAIVARNLDEFHIVRIADRTRSGRDTAKLRRTAQRIADRADEIARGLAETVEHDAGLRLLTDPGELTAAENARARALFAEIGPALTVVTLTATSPLPASAETSVHVVGVLADGSVVRVAVPTPAAVHMVSPGRYVAAETLVAAGLGELTGGQPVEATATLRVTRGGEVSLTEADPQARLAELRTQLARRHTAPCVRVQLTRGADPRIVHAVQAAVCGDTTGPIGYADTPVAADALETLADEGDDTLRWPAQQVRLPRELVAANTAEQFFAALREHDILVHHPYTSFRHTVLAMLQHAADDDDRVVAVSQTLYRTGTNSDVVAALCRAAKAGKSVTVSVEVTARGDEQANLDIAETLAAAGCQVVYGAAQRKTHAKLLVVVRREGGGLVRYAHIGTGNYHTGTATKYEDLGLLTADPGTTQAVADVLSALARGGTPESSEKLLVAPDGLREQLLAKVGEVTDAALRGEDSWLRWKVNHLLDPQLVTALVDAADAGSHVEIIVRGMCAVPASLAGTPRLRVRSVLGRFLEHSRIYQFRGGNLDEVWIGSADAMPRNLDRRVEALVRVDDQAARGQLEQLLDMYTAPATAVFELGTEGWHTVRGDQHRDVQQQLLLAAAGA